MLDIEDWMLSCNKQINKFRQTQYQQFWGKILNDERDTVGPPSTTLSEETKVSSITYSSEDGTDLIKFKSEIGVINKLSVTILVAYNLKEEEVLDINQFRRVKKIKDKMACNLIFATFDESDDRTKMDKFLAQTEMTPIENNFPLKLHLPTECLDKLMI